MAVRNILVDERPPGVPIDTPQSAVHLSLSCQPPSETWQAIFLVVRQSSLEGRDDRVVLTIGDAAARRLPCVAELTPRRGCTRQAWPRFSFLSESMTQDTPVVPYPVSAHDGPTSSRSASSSPTTETYQGIEAFRTIANEWNDLWDRTEICAPTVRFETIELFVNTFGDPSQLLGVVVRDGDRLVAGIPLVRSVVGKVLPIHRLPANCWSHNGDLLLDAQIADSDSVLEQLAEGLRQAGVRWLALDDVPYESGPWQGFRSVLARRGAEQYLARQHAVGVIDTLGHWSDYEAAWSSKFRTNVRRSINRLNRLGEVEFRRHQNPAPHEVEQLMNQGFVIEDRSWKGEQGTSVLRTDGMKQYMIEEARRMAAAGFLEIWLLLLDNKPIAFEYAHLAKRIGYAHKIAFDPDYRASSPGKLLTRHRLRSASEDPKCDLVNTLGVMCPLKAKWSTRTYFVGRLYASLGDPLPNALLSGLSQLRSLARRLRPPEEAPNFAPASRSYLNSVDREPISL